MSETTEKPATEEIAPEETLTKSHSFGDRYLRNRPFLVVTNVARPSKDAKTSVKGWNNTQTNVNVFERVSVVDSVSGRLLQEATIIIDILNNKVVKNRYATSSDEEKVLQHFISKYGKEVTQGLEIWARSNRPVPKVTALEAEKSETET